MFLNLEKTRIIVGGSGTVFGKSQFMRIFFPESLRQFDEFTSILIRQIGLKSRISISEDGRVGTTAFLKYLYVKVGARVTLIYNVWTFDGLVDGVMGTIVGIKWNKEQSKVEYIVVEFDNPKAGRNQRLKYSRQAAKYSSKNGTPIFRHEMNFNLRGSTSAQGTVIQFPLKLGWASTSHRLQVVHLSMYIP